MKFTRIVVIGILLTFLIGCSKTNIKQEYGYPIDTKEVLSYYITDISPIDEYTSIADTPYMIEWQKRTGVKIEWKISPKGRETPTLELLFASGDMPDIVEALWSRVPGGLEKLNRAGKIINLNEYIQSPDSFLMEYLKHNEQADKLIQSISGDYYYYPMLTERDPNTGKLPVTSGYIMRKDWLDALGMSVPETIEQWYDTLKQFRETLHVQCPLSVQPSYLRYLASAYDIDLGFYLDQNQVKYGRILPEYKEFLTQLNRWYQEGLLDENFANLDNNMIEEQVLNGKTGATFGWIGSNIGKWLDTMKERDTTFDLIGVPFPAPNPGEVSSFNTANLETNGYGAAITTSCKNPELAVKVLEYAYSPEGWMFSNFGIEGISYTQEDGNPQYTETIKQNDEGKTMLEMMTLYTRANIPAPMVQDYRYTQQYLSIYPSQRQTQEYWSRGDNSSNKLPVPVDHITHWNGEDMTSVEEEIQQYADTMFVKFVLGLEPIEHFEEYVQHIKTLGIDALLQLKQQAYEQYLQN